MKRPQRVLFDGYYGMRNVGDDAFCAVAADVARHSWGISSPRFLAPQSKLPVMLGRSWGVLPERPRIRGHLRLKAASEAALARHVVHVGGSTFMRPLARHRDQGRLIGLANTSLHAVGISIGPFATRRDAIEVGRLLQRFSSISVRDEASAVRLADIAPDVAIRVGFDVAVLLADHGIQQSQRRPSTRPVLGVSVCAHEARRGLDERIERQRFLRTQATINELARRTDLLVRILVFNDHPHWGDHRLSAELADGLRCPVEMIARHPDPRVMLGHVAECDAVLATRLHAGIFAFSAGVPFALIAYEQKVRDLAHHLGMSETLVFDRRGPDRGEHAELIEKLLHGCIAAPNRSLADAKELAARCFPDELDEAT